MNSPFGVFNWKMDWIDRRQTDRRMEDRTNGYTSKEGSTETGQNYVPYFYKKK